MKRRYMLTLSGALAASSFAAGTLLSQVEVTDTVHGFCAWPTPAVAGRPATDTDPEVPAVPAGWRVEGVIESDLGPEQGKTQRGVAFRDLDAAELAAFDRAREVVMARWQTRAERAATAATPDGGAQ